MNLVPVFFQDPFSPKLLASPPLAVTEEQRRYIKRVLDISSSDSRFSEKAYSSITLILTGGIVQIPLVNSLTPSSAEVGDPSFTLHVHGTNFTSLSKIVFNGGEEPTTYVSATELTTGVDMTTVSGPSTIPIGVLGVDGILSNMVSFMFTNGTPVGTSETQGHALKSSKSPSKESSQEKK